VILGWLILAEPITSRTVVASLLIIAAVALITTEKSRGAR
jgi:drug/metabolite transporter (DMT)-like permease